jgi:glycosyltransferase involved in cell wall biosynthesis
MAALSVIILTKDEEEFIERCVRSVLWADEVLVIDSGSTDRTREIAASLGARVYEEKEGLGYLAKRCKAPSLAKNDWVFLLDCDEIVTPELARSIQEVMNSPMDERDGYSVDRRGDFYGILLPNFSRPSKRLNYVRLFNRRYSVYKQTINPHEEVHFPGKAIPLQGTLIHWRAYIMDEYISSANRYAKREAEVLNKKGSRVNGLTLFVRPILRFLWCYIIHSEFRLGMRGLVHSMLMATSEYIRYAKLWEMQNAARVLHPPTYIYSDCAIANKPKDVVVTAQSGGVS